MAKAGVQERIRADLIGAVKARDAQRATTLRLLSAAIRNEELARAPSELADSDILQIVEREAKKRREAAQAFEQGARPESALRERAEEKILAAYLPPPMSDAELEKAVSEIVSSLEGSALETGKVMGAVMAKLRGRADGTRVRTLVSRILRP